MTFVGGTLRPPIVPLVDFMQLAKIPIVVYYCDNIPEQPSTNPGQTRGESFAPWRDSGGTR